MGRSAINPDQFSTFGELIKYLRRRAGLTQRELSLAVGYSDTQISRIEKDVRVPDAATLQALFVPALDLDEEPGWVSRLLELAASARLEESREEEVPISPNNLPASLTIFIGREHEQEQVIQLLHTHRLVTLIGPGGIGKTRLSFKVGERGSVDFPDGVWLVELAPLSDPDLLLQTLAGALGLITQNAISHRDQLINFLRPRKILLILDNCEHLLDACAQSADLLLKHCPGLKILATSRQALGIPGETRYQVPPLGLPDFQDTLEKIQAHEAVRLFIERARQARVDFALTEENASSIARICSRLDGIPLALELAAARVDMFSTEEIVFRLDGSFNLLTGGSRTALPRQQTLRASIDWSWDLLSGNERSLMHRLTVFTGGWTLDAAEAVCRPNDGSPFDVLESLSQLVAKSIVIVDRAGFETRYDCHEIIRQYAREKLIESGEEDAVRRQHLLYYLSLSKAAASALHGPQQGEWIDRLKEDRDNFRSALEYASLADLEAGLYLAARMFNYWAYFDLREGLRWLTDLIGRRGSDSHPSARAAALQAQGSIYWHFQQFEVARSILEECLILFRRLGDKQGEIDALLSMGGVQQFLKGMDASNEYRWQALALAESLGDIWRQALALESLGWDQRDPGRSRMHWREAIRIFRQLGDWRNLEQGLAILGFTILSEGDIQEAQVLLDEALEVNQRTHDRRSLEFILTGKSQLALLRGEYGSARALIQENIDILEAIGNRMGSLWGRARLGNVAFRSGNIQEARQILSQVIAEFHMDRNKSGLAFALDKMVGLFILEKKYEAAARLIGWSDAARSEVGDPRPRIEQQDIDRDSAAIKKKLGSSDYETAYEAGRSMSLDEAVASTLAGKL